MSIIAITDYFDAPGEEEKDILGDLVGTNVNEDTEVLLVWHEKINKEYVSKLPRLKGVQRYGVGYDNLDLDYLKGRGITCCNNPDYGVDEVSDTAVAMIMNIARGLFKYNYVAKNLRRTWQENVNTTIKRNSATVVGVIGAGRIGGSVLLKCKSLNFQTVFFDPYKERGYEKLYGSKRVDSLEELLNVSDIISIHVPLNEKTKNMIDKNFISNMKKGASLVNTARGGLIKNLDNIYEMLINEQLSSVALDVLPDEPPGDSKLINAWRDNSSDLNSRIIINPHTSYYSNESFKEIKTKAAENALRLYNGNTPYNIL